MVTSCPFRSHTPRVTSYLLQQVSPAGAQVSSGHLPSFPRRWFRLNSSFLPIVHAPWLRRIGSAVSALSSALYGSASPGPDDHDPGVCPLIVHHVACLQG